MHNETVLCVYLKKASSDRGFIETDIQTFYKVYRTITIGVQSAGAPLQAKQASGSKLLHIWTNNNMIIK